MCDRANRLVLAKIHRRLQLQLQLQLDRLHLLRLRLQLDRIANS
jgi:hypothetical protein